MQTKSDIRTPPHKQSWSEIQYEDTTKLANAIDISLKNELTSVTATNKEAIVVRYVELYLHMTMAHEVLQLQRDNSTGHFRDQINWKLIDDRRYATYREWIFSQ